VEQPTADEKAADEAFATNCPEDVKPGREVILKYKVAAQLAYKRLEDAQTGALAKKAKAEATGPPDPDDTKEADARAVVLRLRGLYRKAVEFRVAHALYESRYRRARLCLSFAHLFLSALTSAVLFLSAPQMWSVVLSLVLMGLNSLMQLLGLEAKENEHAQARTAFSGLQRSMATVLILADNSRVKEVFEGLARQFREAERAAVKILGLDFLKNPETKQKMFQLIGAQASLKAGGAFQSKARGAAAKARAAESEAKARAAYAEHKAKRAKAPGASSLVKLSKSGNKRTAKVLPEEVLPEHELTVTDLNSS